MSLTVSDVEQGADGRHYVGECDDCGFTNRYRTEGLAWRGLRQHSCDWQRHLAEVRARGAAKRAAVDRTRKPCLHKRASHTHGTRACYVLDRCRCEPCSRANAEAEAWRERQKAYGRYDKYVDADECRQHLRDLMAQGMGLKRIAEVMGIGTGGLSKIVYTWPGHEHLTRRVLRTTHERIMAVDLDLAGGAKVDGTGTQRRLRALVAIGYSMSDLGRRIGFECGNIWILMHRRDRVLRATADKVAALYDELSMQPNTPTGHHEKIAASRARRYAKRRGWAPPLAWDEETIDDPEARPDRGEPGFRDTDIDEQAVWRRMNGDKTVRLTVEEKDEVVARLRAMGVEYADIERTTGVNAHRHGRRSAA